MTSDSHGVNTLCGHESPKKMVKFPLLLFCLMVLCHETEFLGLKSDEGRSQLMLCTIEAAWVDLTQLIHSPLRITLFLLIYLL